MKQFLLILGFLLIPIFGFGQIDRGKKEISQEAGLRPELSEARVNPNMRNSVSTNDSVSVLDYKIISVYNDTTSVDTSLTIEDDYRFNYLRKDNFGLLPFSNVGRPYTRLTYDLRSIENNLVPEFGAQARHFNFKEVEDIYYYRVPTPFTEVYFKTVFEQGQTLETLFTVNTSENLNLSIGYKGLRSLGKYQNILTSTGNFQVAANYNTPNKRYHLKTHFVSQDLMSQENGGLDSLALEQYLSGEEEYTDRSRLEVNFDDAENILYGKRFFLEHSYDLVSRNDSVSSSKFSLGHVLDFSDKKFIFRQSSANEFFGPAFESVNLRDEVKFENIYNEISLRYSNGLLGNIAVKGGLTNYNYGYNSVLELDQGRIANRILGETISAGAEYSKSFGPLALFADAMLGVSGDFTGSSFDAGAVYRFSPLNTASLTVNRKDQAPNFNFLLYQSDYINYNWQNNFSNVITSSVEVRFDFPKLLNAEVSYGTISDYAYFGLNEQGMVNPFQHLGNINYFKIKAEKELSWGKFSLNNSLLYQEVLEGENVFHVPSFVSRNTLYFQDYWFKRALFLQTGFTLSYFTDYYMDGYDPVLAEFFVQNGEEFGNFPTVDFFFNGKIRQARIFFKLEHLNTLLMGNDNFSAPLYPYRDFGVRFGLVWNFFM